MSKSSSNNNDIINFYGTGLVKKHLLEYDNPNYELTGMKHPFYAGIISASGGGKTNLLMNLLQKMSNGSGTWSHIYVVNKMQEPLYEAMEDAVNKKNITFYRPNAIPTPESLKISGQSLIIFDDCVGENNHIQSKITDYFIRGRKLNNFGISVIILSQSYYAVPKTIRSQFHYLILLKLRQKRDIDMILNNCGKLGITKDDLLHIYEDATKSPMNFLKIDIDASDINRTFSSNWTNYYVQT